MKPLQGTAHPWNLSESVSMTQSRANEKTQGEILSSHSRHFQIKSEDASCDCLLLIILNTFNHSFDKDEMLQKECGCLHLPYQEFPLKLNAKENLWLNLNFFS